MASTPTRLMTVEEFLKLPECDAYLCELRHGELVQMTRPVLRHSFIQQRLQRLFSNAADDNEVAFIEIGCRLSEHDLRVADVVYAPRTRWQSIDLAGRFPGSPDLVVEVLSPSNSAAEILEREQIYLENGAREFWIVDPDRKQVKISTPEGRTATYKAGSSIPVYFAPGKTIAVDAIFD